MGLSIGTRSLAGPVAGLTLAAAVFPTGAFGQCINYLSFLHIAGGAETPGIARRVAVSGDFAFIADGASGLQVLDVSNPTSPVLAGSVGTVSADGVAAAGSHVYIAKYDFAVVDVSNPADPTIVSSIDLPGRATEVWASGSHAFVVENYPSVMQVIDVSDPAAPTIVGELALSSDTQDVVVSGSHAYVATNSGVRVVDVSDPTAPSAVTTIGVGQVVGVALSGDLLVLVRSASLEVVDVSNPGTPILLSILPIPGSAQKAAIFGEFALVATGSTMITVRITDPAAPELRGTIATAASALDVAVSGDYAFVAAYQWGLQVVDVSRPRSPQILGFGESLGDPVGIDVQGGYAYVADSGGGLRVVDVHPFPPQFVGQIFTYGYSVDVAVLGQHAYVADSEMGLLIADVTEPTAPVVVSEIDMPGVAKGVAVSACHVYLVDGVGLHVIDVTSAADPVILGEIDTPGNASGVAVFGDRAYVADTDAGLHVVDVSSPTAPVILGTAALSSARAVDVTAQYAFVAGDGSPLRIVDVSIPSLPVVVDSVAMLGGSWNVTLSGNHAYVACRSKGLSIVDILDPLSPIIVGELDTPGLTMDLAVSREYVFFADEEASDWYRVAGVLVAEAQCPQAPPELTMIGCRDGSVTPESGSYPEGTFVEIEAHPDAGYVFTEWLGQGHGSYSGVDNPAVVTVREPLVQTAVFENAIYTLEMLASEGGAVTPATGGVASFSEVAIEAIPDPHYAFREWRGEGDGSYTGADNPATVTMNGPITQVAEFDRVAFELTLSLSPVDPLVHTGEPGLGSVYLWLKCGTAGGISALEADVSGTLDPIAFLPAPGILNAGNGDHLELVMLSCMTGPVVLGEFLILAPDEGALCLTAASVSSEMHVSNCQLPVARFVWPQDLKITGVSTDGSTPCEMGRACDEPLLPGMEVAAPEAAPSITYDDAFVGTFPNPFTASTSIRFSLSRPERVSLSVYDVAGRLVRRLLEEQHPTGPHELAWSGRDAEGHSVPAGIYFVQLQAGRLLETRKVIRLGAQ